MVRPDSTSIMMDFFLPSNFIMYKFITEESLIRLALSFFVKETKWAIMLRFFSVWVVNHKVLYYWWCVMWYGNYWITCTYYRYIVLVCPEKKIRYFFYIFFVLYYAVVLKKWVWRRGPEGLYFVANWKRSCSLIV